MDPGRIADIKKAEATINNPNAPRSLRAAAARAKAEIIKQARDPQLQKMRQELLRAAADHNPVAERDIAARIKKYTRQHFEDYL